MGKKTLLSAIPLAPRDCEEREKGSFFSPRPAGIPHPHPHPIPYCSLRDEERSRERQTDGRRKNEICAAKTPPPPSDPFVYVPIYTAPPRCTFSLTQPPFLLPSCAYSTSKQWLLIHILFFGFTSGANRNEPEKNLRSIALPFPPFFGQGIGSFGTLSLVFLLYLSSRFARAIMKGREKEEEGEEAMASRAFTMKERRKEGK